MYQNLSLANHRFRKISLKDPNRFDQAYFEHIANAISTDADWTFYYHASKSKKYYAKFAKDIVNFVGKQCVKVKHDSKLKRVKCSMK